MKQQHSSSSRENPASRPARFAPRFEDPEENASSPRSPRSFFSHTSVQHSSAQNKPHHLLTTMSDEYEHYDDSDIEDEEEEVLTHAEHKAKGNESYKGKGR